MYFLTADVVINLGGIFSPMLSIFTRIGFTFSMRVGLFSPSVIFVNVTGVDGVL